MPKLKSLPRQKKVKKIRVEQVKPEFVDKIEVGLLSLFADAENMTHFENPNSQERVSDATIEFWKVQIKDGLDDMFDDYFKKRKDAFVKMRNKFKRLD